tara:strand:- start:1159 stop:1422 length:264 start_codon:yes stop_codon:yes gene_type:complete
MARTVFNAGYVVPMDQRDRVIENGVVAIEDDRIIYVGAANGFDAIGFAADKTVSAKDRAILTVYRNEVSRETQSRAENIWARAEKNF